MKKTCTLFLLLVMTIQMLPVQQMGSLLFSNQFTEELPHSVDTEKDFSKKADLKSDFLCTPPFSIASVYFYFSSSHRIIADAIPSNHSGDIHVPPPNC